MTRSELEFLAWHAAWLVCFVVSVFLFVLVFSDAVKPEFVLFATAPTLGCMVIGQIVIGLMGRGVAQ